MDLLLERTIELNCSKTHAFRVFTEMTDLWWPPHHRKDKDAALVLEQVSGGRLMEKSTNGAVWIIGEIVNFIPPDTLEFNWFPGSPHVPTNVRIKFLGDTTSATIAIEHRAISDEAIENWPNVMHLFARGWDTILPALATFCKTIDKE